MQEDFLHYVWQFKKFNFRDAVTTSGAKIAILNSGSPNMQSGPDFFNSTLRIGNQLWAGNVEIHINSSDWYNHHHEVDPNYDNVILHVVWEHDADVYRKDNSVIPVLELNELISESGFSAYKNLLEHPSGKWINCEKDFASLDDFSIQNWLERLYIERLEQKSEGVTRLLTDSSNNWEEVLFHMLAKNFGLNINGEAFFSVAKSIPFSVVRKVRDQEEKLEALLLGQAGLLQKEIEERYYQNLQKEYSFLKHKYQLEHQGVIPVKYFRLRPDNFPNLRLAQLSELYHCREHLFSEVIQAGDVHQLREIFNIRLSEFWECHFSFEKPHKKRKKQLSNKFVDLILINTIIPLRFYYAKQNGESNNEEIIELIRSLESESNKIIHKFNQLKPKIAQNALQSQALLQLKSKYCDKNQCLKCSFGIKLLEGSG